MSLILDGKKIRNEAIPEIAKRVAVLSFKPILTIIQVGERADTTSFVKSKKSFASEIGVEIRHIQVPENITQKELIEIIEKNNEDKTVNGLIVQLPLPIGIDSDAVIDSISPKKDVDALTSYNVKRWLNGCEGAILPATARGVKKIFKKYNIDLFGKTVTIVGRSTLVGKPIAAMCLNENATVTICHSKTADLFEKTKNADVLIVAAGRPGLIKEEYVKEGQVVIDVGINTINGEKLDDEIPAKKLVGDVDFENVSKKVAAITPVPGGVGQMTVVSLFENLLDLISQ